MKVRILRLGGAVAIALLAFLAFYTAVSLAAPDEKTDGGYKAIVPADGTAAVLARRKISIPFGIDTPLALREEGQLVIVTGHTECPEEGTFELRVQVKQKSSKGIAMGQTSGVCDENVGQWQADAWAVDAKQLTEGEAQVCAVAVVHFDKGAATRRWCKTVRLVSG